jgi:hypothetical protein
MTEEINEKVSVVSIYERDSIERYKVKPYQFRWQGKKYIIEQVDYYHIRKTQLTKASGYKKEHVYDVICGAMHYRLVCDPSTLHWKLESLDDGNTN